MAGNKTFGKNLDKAIAAKYHNRADFIRDLRDELKKDEKTFKSIETDLSNTIKGRKEFNRKYYLPAEKLLGIRVYDLFGETQTPFAAPRPGLFEVGSYGDESAFQSLAEAMDGVHNVLSSYDEWDKGILDYVIEADNLKGLRYLIDKGRDCFDQLSPNSPISFSGASENYQGERCSMAILKLLAKDEGDAKCFTELFDSHNALSTIASSKNSIWEREEYLETILNSPALMGAVCAEPSKVSEERLNAGRTREKRNGYYTGVCASNWLTPLLNYALANEKQHGKQARVLLKQSIEVAKQTYRTVLEQKVILSNSGRISVGTKKGLVMLDHHYVIGVIGEPQTDCLISSLELQRQLDELNDWIGKINAFSSIARERMVQGKIVTPNQSETNPLFSEFLTAAQGCKYVLQRSEMKVGGPYAITLDSPKGRPIENDSLSPGQWEQIGCGLKAIHSIPSKEIGKSYCHGRFTTNDFLFLETGELEVIRHFAGVHLGDPMDDLFDAALCALFPVAGLQGNLENMRALLKGYGYDEPDFEMKLYDHLVNRAKIEDNKNTAYSDLMFANRILSLKLN